MLCIEVRVESTRAQRNCDEQCFFPPKLLVGSISSLAICWNALRNFNLWYKFLAKLLNERIRGTCPSFVISNIFVGAWMVERLHLGCWRLRPSRWRILRQSKLILCRLSVNGIIKVHTRLVPQHNVPVNEETHLSCLKYNKDQICVMTWIHVSKVRLPGRQLREWQRHRQLPIR